MYTTTNVRCDDKLSRKIWKQRKAKQSEPTSKQKEVKKSFAILSSLQIYLGVNKRIILRYMISLW